ncbi:phage tail family protein [Curtobacterium sp. C1]|uniref:phage distal tail protein n=1 Tax=Curtobacterium sp. C1 TaxID=2898151 RepID=UPI001E509871|nr:phage tail domain-containing protein [Curtobacterium sp. C1]UFU14641.1 phage tail family protein [Curtobacterium sp. C1]
MTALNPYQGTSNGLTFGPGTDVQLVSIDGLRDTTTVNQGDVQLPRLNGAAPGTNTLGERVLVLTFAVFAPVAAFETVISNIATAFQPMSSPNALQPLQFMLPGWLSARQVKGRTTKGAIPIDTDFQFNVERAIALEFTCPDPLIYDTVVQTQSTGLPSPTAGLTFPASAPFVFGASTGGSLQFVNIGNVPGPMVMTITGPVTNPILRIGNLYLGFNITLGASDVLVIDTAAHTATLNGTAARANLVMAGSSWLQVPPGTVTVQVASSDSAAVAATFTGTFSSSWGFM